jgi:hypothetical protein
LVAPEPVQPEPVEPDPMEPEPIGPDLASPPAPAAAYEPVPTTAGAEVRLERHQADDQTWREEAPERREERATPAPPRPSYSVAETGGPSVVQLLQGILSARPPQQSAAAPVRQAAAGGAGAPTRPAADALSLSSVFGEEASSTPPAVPASNPGAGSVSFDDFFNSQGGSPASRTQRAPDPKNDDLDQFHAWLQNLKR